MRNLLFGQLGHCHICIRKSFLGAAIAWIALLLAVGFGQDRTALYLTMLAVGLSFLWVGHIIAFLLRLRLPRQEHLDVGRRSSLALIGRGVAAVALISFLPTNAHAQYGGCGREGCDPCFRPFWGRDGGGRVCWRCHSCGQNCGGQTC
jgi:hypothetical protein